MIKSLLLLAFFPVMLIAQTKTVEIDVHLSQLPDSLLFYLSDGQNNLDSAWSKKDILHFTYHKSKKEPQNLAFISKDRKYFYSFWVEYSAMKLSGSFNSLRELAVEGSVTDYEFKEMMRLTQGDENTIKSLKLKLEEYQINKSPDTAKLSIQLARLSEKLKAKKSAFIGSYPNSVISTKLLAMETRNKNFSNNECLKLFALLSQEQQNSPAGQSILKSVNLYANPKLGDPAPLFTMNSSTGKPISLADFKGRPILLIFWATWCAPCLEEMPAMKKIYEKYKAKDLLVVAISMDEQQAQWLNHIKKENLDWINLNDGEMWSNKAALTYGVTMIPDNFLIDATGRLIYRGYATEALESKLQEILD